MVAGLNDKAVHERLNVHKMVPRKLEQPINPAASGSYGWGLYFVEKEYCKGWYKVVVLLGTMVLAWVGGIVLTLMLANAFRLNNARRRLQGSSGDFCDELLSVRFLSLGRVAALGIG